MKQHYRTIVISDLHLGIKASKAREVVHFLKSNSCELLILNGDIIDGWQLRKSGEWKKRHSRVMKLVLKYMNQKDMRIIYLRGNHDDFLDEVIPLEMGNFSIRRDYVLQSGSKRYYITHGDIFDSITTNLRWLAKLGDIGYTFLLWFNRYYNQYRTWRGLPYYSFSAMVKQKVKSAVSFISDFEKELAEVARIRHCDGVITGHIHQAADKYIEGIHYLNSGDWVESMTALVEDFEGKWSIIDYNQWLVTHQEERKKNSRESYIPEISIVPAS